MPGGMDQGPNGQRPDLPEGMTPPDGQMPGGQRPDGQQPPEPPEGGQMPQGLRPGGMGGPIGQPGEASTTFTLVEGANFFQIAG